MTSSSLSRRAALGVLGAGSALAFAGCAARVQPLSADASTSYRADYSGEITFNSYDTSAGEYVRATRTQRAKNVPKPVKTAMMTEKSSAGLYSLFGFLWGSLHLRNYDQRFLPLQRNYLCGRNKRSRSL